MSQSVTVKIEADSGGSKPNPKGDSGGNGKRTAIRFVSKIAEVKEVTMAARLVAQAIKTMWKAKAPCRFDPYLSPSCKVSVLYKVHNNPNQTQSKVHTMAKPKANTTNSSVATAENDDNDSLLDLDLASVPEMTVLDEDTEVELAIERFMRGKSEKNGENFVLLFFEIPSDPTIKSFSQYFGLGSPTDTPKQKNEKLNRFIAVCKVFDVDHTANPLDLNAFVGKTAWAILGVNEGNEKYGATNSIKSFVAEK